MPKPSWPPQPWARPCPETALSLAVGLGCLGACPPWGRDGEGRQLHRGLGLPYARPTGTLGPPAALSCLGRVKSPPAAPAPAPVAAPLCPQPPHLPISACRSLPLMGFGEKGGGGNRTGSMAAAMLVGVIYIVYKSIKQSGFVICSSPWGPCSAAEEDSTGLA